MSINREPAILKPEAKTAACTHFWVIDDPDGPISTGKCKHCGTVREFYNCLDNIEMPDDDKSQQNLNN